jgi:GR25 family glycosyltransferase involved in LPS biosynthesis
MKRRLKDVDFELIRADDIKHSNVSAELSTLSTIGCALSHRYTWNKVCEDGHDKALILEDDCIFNKPPQTFEEINIPDDCDIYLIGYFGLCDYNKNYTNFNKIAGVFLKKRKFKKFDDYFCPEFFFGLHCYIITRKGAEKLKNLTITGHIDFQLNYLENLNIYAHKECIANQEAFDDSTINKTKFNMLNYILTERDRFNIPQHVYLSAPAFQIGGVVCNIWVIVYAILGIMGFPIYVLPFVTSDMSYQISFVAGVVVNKIMHRINVMV